MTENEALKLMESLQISKDCEMVKSLDFKATVIKALEDLQQYRAIGTVKGYERAIEISIENYNLYKEYKSKLQEFESIGTIEEFKVLKEKNEPRIPNYEGDGYDNMGQIVLDTWICPKCEKDYEVDYDDYDYCPNCGQHIDHSGFTEDD